MAAASVNGPPAITTRPQRAEDDLPFLRELYRSLRWEELDALPGWTDESKRDFFAQQFAAQHAHYSKHYADADFRIVLAAGQPIGRLAIERNMGCEIRVVDIGFLPAWRNRGLGTRLLKDVLDEAQATAKTVTIHVEQFNPAQNLYRRLGFRPVEARGPYWLMEWRPSEPAQAKTA